MTTYQRGHEPAGAPVTWEYTNANGSVATLYGIAKPFVQVLTQYADPIARLAHAAAEWRKLAEEAANVLKGGNIVPSERFAWCDRFDAMKETFGD